MENYYTRIRKIQNELTALKTSATVSATVVASSQQDFALTIPMKLISSYSCQSEKAYIITITNAKSEEFLSMLTIGTDDPEDRMWLMAEKTTGARQHVYEISVGGNSDDLAKLKAGESVTLTMGFTVTATTRFSLTISERTI